MSSFICEQCGAQIIEDENGNYITGCEHYPLPTERVGALALEHWRWISQLLFTMEVKTVPVTTAKYLYISAFLHGWKHAKEEGDGTKK